MTPKYVKVLILCNLVLIGVCVALLMKLNATTNALNAVSVPSDNSSNTNVLDVAKSQENSIQIAEKPELSATETQNREFEQQGQNSTALVEQDITQLTQQDLSDIEFHMRGIPHVYSEPPAEDVELHQLMKEIERKQIQANQ